MKKIVVVVPHSHTWLWTQTCLACLHRNPPRADGYEVAVIVVDNSPWSPAIRGIEETDFRKDVRITKNPKTNRFHASALDCVVEMDWNFDYLMALETDVMVCRPNWLQWFLDNLRESDYAIGAWHHEQFINPSCTLYRMDVLRMMLNWCRTSAPQDELRWGQNFSETAPLDNNLRNVENPAEILTDLKGWIGGPFAEKRGWHPGTTLKEMPSGQLKGPGWYEPGQQLHHWAVQAGYTYTVCPTLTTKRDDNLPLQTMYGVWGAGEPSIYPPAGRMALGPVGYDHLRQLEAREFFGNCWAAHLWGGTRALDILKHEVTCGFVRSNMPMWLAREARFWKEVVPSDVQHQTLDLIRRYGWHYTGQSNAVSGGDARDREAVEYVRRYYKDGGVEW